MRTALGYALTLAVIGAASSSHALQNRDWDAVEGTAQHSLEFAKTNESAGWVNPDSGTEGTFTPVETFEGPDGQVCREYAIDAIIDGRAEVVYGTACRQPDGSWVEANDAYLEEEAPTVTREVYTGTNWWWWVPSIAISGGYCSSSFCVGGGFGSYYPTWFYPTLYYPTWYYSNWYYPSGFRFSYWDYGHHNGHRGDYYCSRNHNHGYHTGHNRHYRGGNETYQRDRTAQRDRSTRDDPRRTANQSRDRRTRRDHYRSADSDRQQSVHGDQRSGHGDQRRSARETAQRDRASNDAHSGSREVRMDRSSHDRSQRDRSTHERARPDRSTHERSRPDRSTLERARPDRSAHERAQPDRSAHERSRPERSDGQRVASIRSGGERAGGQHASRGQSRDTGSRGGSRGARPSSGH